MGGSGSTRRITVEEEDDTGMVKVSESVVRRLIGEPEPSGPSNERLSSAPQAYQQQQRGDDREQLAKYYENRIQALEKMNSELFDDQKKQFAEAVQEVEQKFLKTTASPVCQELQAEVLACYQANPQKTLLCSPQVQAFNECVQQQREKILTKKG